MKSSNCKKNLKLSQTKKNLNLYENGKYNDDIRKVHEDVLSMGLSSRNIEKCVRFVLEKLAKVKVGRLPKVTFAKNMFLEARCLAQIHVASVLSENQGNLTLHSDGTSKHGRSYTTYDIQAGEDVLVVGMREIGGADAQSQLDLFQELLDEVGENLGKGGNDFGKKVFLNIKNLMSDRCAVQKKFNNLFIKLRKEYLPDVVRNWSNLSNVEQESFGKVNEFFCGLHFLVGLADQAEACLKVWKKILYNGQNVGSLAHEGYSNGESGTVRLIRSVCKSVCYRGCEMCKKWSSNVLK